MFKDSIKASCFYNLVSYICDCDKNVGYLKIPLKHLVSTIWSPTFVIA